MRPCNHILIVILFITVVSSPVIVFAHPGRTDSVGCHTCRTNCSSWGLSYGEYHCHRAKALPQPLEPIKSHKVEDGKGYTTPAPEYKIPKVDESENSINQKDLKPTKSTKSPTEDKKISFWERIISFFRASLIGK